MATESEVEIELPVSEGLLHATSSPSIECKCNEDNVQVTETPSKILLSPESQQQSEEEPQTQTEKYKSSEEISSYKVTTPVKDQSLHSSPSQSKSQSSPLTQATSASTTQSTTSTRTCMNTKDENESRFKITILNLSGISIRSIERAEKFGSPSRRSAQNFSITASVSFTGSCDPCDMRVVSSGLCSSSGRLICESRPVIVPNGMTDGLVAVWDDSNPTRPSLTPNCTSSSFVHGHGCNNDSHDSNHLNLDLEGNTSLYSTDKIIFGKKKGAILANPTARPHLYVTTRDLSSSMDIGADSGDDMNSLLKMVDSSKHSDIMQKTTYSTAPSSITTGLDMEDEEADDDESDASQNLNTGDLNTPIALSESRKCVSLPIDLGHHATMRENTRKEREQKRQRHQDQYRESSSASKSTLSTFSQFSQSPSRTKSIKSGPTPTTDFHSLTVVNAPSTIEASSLSHVPEILEFQVALHTHQIPTSMSSEEEYEDLNSVRSSCPPQCGAVAHLVLFPDLLQEGNETGNGSKFFKGSRSGKSGKSMCRKGNKDGVYDNEIGAIREDSDEKEDTDIDTVTDANNVAEESYVNERVIELPVRKPFAHLTRGISSVSGLTSRCFSAEASVGPSKKRFVTDPEAYIDLEEDAIIRIKVEKCTEIDQVTLEKEGEQLSWDNTECFLTDKSLVDNDLNAVENDDNVKKNSEDDDDYTPPMVKAPLSTTMQEVQNMLEQESLLGQVDSAEQHTGQPGEMCERGGGDHNYKYEHNQNRDLIEDAQNLRDGKDGKHRNDDGQNDVTSPPQEAPPIFCRGLDLDAILKSFSGMLMHCGDQVHHRGLNGGGSMDSTIYTAGTL